MSLYPRILIPWSSNQTTRASKENALLDELSEDLRRPLAANCHITGSFAGLEHKLADLTNSVRVENIDTVLCEFVSMLKGDEDTRPPRPANRHAKRRNHNALRRFRYAKCQEAYHKCPRKLVDMAIVEGNVFLPKVEPPEAGQIRELYEQPPLTGAPPDQSAYFRVKVMLLTKSVYWTCSFR